MKNTLFIIFCFFIIKSGFSQDTFTYKTVNASNATETTILLEGAEGPKLGGTTGKFSGFAAKGGGTITNGILGSLSVSPTGGASYTIPIDVPPGLNGVAPEIALTFNSQSGNSIAGYGWNISGLSSITRIPSTQYHDGVIDAVDFDLQDRFALDGQRLIIKTGTYGTNGAVYQTEQYSNIKIVSYGTHPETGVEGPRYFKVFYPDGSIAHYGYNDDSRGHLSYAISYWENPQGVRINYIYTTVGNVLRLEKITYGARGTSTPINDIEFEYSRCYGEASYVNGVLFGSNNILNTIKVKGNGTAYRNYVLSSSEDVAGDYLRYYRLDAVNEYTGDNQLNRGVTFNYGFTNRYLYESNYHFGGLNLTNIEKRNAKVETLDISGDGKLDFIVYPTLGADTKKKFWLFTDLGTFNYGIEVNTGEFEEIFPVSWLNHQNKLLANQGLAVVQNSGSTQVKFKVYSSEGAAQPIAYKYEKTWTAPTHSGSQRVPLKYLSGDFDGDGLSDVIAVEENYSGSSISKTHLIKLDRRLTSNFSSYLGNLQSQLVSTDKLYAYDVTGDGKTNVLQFREGRVYVYGLNESNDGLQFLWDTEHADIRIDYPILFGDYNGDAKSDFITFRGPFSKDFATFSSMGNDFNVDSNTFLFEYESDYEENGVFYGHNLIPMDADGDGITDIVDYSTKTYSNSSTGEHTLKVYINYPYLNGVVTFTRTQNLRLFVTKQIP